MSWPDCRHGRRLDSPRNSFGLFSVVALLLACELVNGTRTQTSSRPFVTGTRSTLSLTKETHSVVARTATQSTVTVTASRSPVVRTGTLSTATMSATVTAAATPSMSTSSSFTTYSVPPVGTSSRTASSTVSHASDSMSHATTHTRTWSQPHTSTPTPGPTFSFTTPRTVTGSLSRTSSLSLTSVTRDKPPTSSMTATETSTVEDDTATESQLQTASNDESISVTVTPPPTNTKTYELSDTLTSITIPPTFSRSHEATFSESFSETRSHSGPTESRSPSVPTPSASDSATKSPSKASVSRTVPETPSTVVSESDASPSFSHSESSSQSGNVSESLSLMKVRCGPGSARVSTEPDAAGITAEDVRMGRAVILLELTVDAVWSMTDTLTNITVTPRSAGRPWGVSAATLTAREEVDGFAATVMPLLRGDGSDPQQLTWFLRHGSVNGRTLRLPIPAAPDYNPVTTETLTITAPSPWCEPEAVPAVVTIEPKTESLLLQPAFIAVTSAASGLTSAGAVAASGMVTADAFAITDIQSMALLAQASCAPAFWSKSSRGLRALLNPVSAAISGVGDDDAGDGAVVEGSTAQLDAIEEAQRRERLALGLTLGLALLFFVLHYLACVVLLFVRRARVKRAAAAAELDCGDTFEEMKSKRDGSDDGRASTSATTGLAKSQQGDRAAHANRSGSADPHQADSALRDDDEDAAAAGAQGAGGGNSGLLVLPMRESAQDAELQPRSPAVDSLATPPPRLNQSASRASPATKTNTVVKSAVEAPPPPPPAVGPPGDTWAAVAADLCFPSISFFFIAILLPGMVSSTWALVLSLTMDVDGRGGVDINQHVGELFFYFLCLGCQFGFLFLIPSLGGSAPVKYQRHKFMVLHSWVAQVAFPVGQWVPRHVTKSLGFTFASSRMFRRVGHGLPYVLSALAAAISAVPWASRANCVVQYSLLASVFFISAISMMVRWPYSSRLLTVFAALVGTLLGVKATFGAFEASGERRLIDAARIGTPLVDLLFMAVNIARLVHTIALIIWARCLHAKWADDFRNQRDVARKARKESREARRAASPKRRQDGRGLGNTQPLLDTSSGDDEAAVVGRISNEDAGADGAAAIPITGATDATSPPARQPRAASVASANSSVGTAVACRRRDSSPPAKRKPGAPKILNKQPEAARHERVAPPQRKMKKLTVADLWSDDDDFGNDAASPLANQHRQFPLERERVPDDVVTPAAAAGGMPSGQRAIGSGITAAENPLLSTRSSSAGRGTGADGAAPLLTYSARENSRRRLQHHRYAGALPPLTAQEELEKSKRDLQSYSQGAFDRWGDVGSSSGGTPFDAGIAAAERPSSGPAPAPPLSPSEADDAPAPTNPMARANLPTAANPRAEPQLSTAAAGDAGDATGAWSMATVEAEEKALFHGGKIPHVSGGGSHRSTAQTSRRPSVANAVDEAGGEPAAAVLEEHDEREDFDEGHRPPTSSSGRRSSSSYFSESWVSEGQHDDTHRHEGGGRAGSASDQRSDGPRKPLYHDDPEL